MMSLKKRVAILVSGLAVCIVIVSSAVFATDYAPRKGFLLGFGPAVGTETNYIRKFGAGFGVRIGGAFNDRFQLYYEDTSLFTSKFGDFLSVSSGMATFQAFVYGNAYAKAGVGFSVASVEQTSSNYYKEYWGGGADVGAGYEFRLTKHFVMAPEVVFNYQRIDGLNYYLPYGYLHLGWYF